MANPWLAHVKKERAKAKNKGKSYKQVLIAAKGTYKKKGAPKTGTRKKKCPDE
jgi:poly(3-hydroxyalkanoate) synthetase